MCACEAGFCRSLKGRRPAELCCGNWQPCLPLEVASAEGGRPGSGLEGAQTCLRRWNLPPQDPEIKENKSNLACLITSINWPDIKSSVPDAASKLKRAPCFVAQGHADHVLTQVRNPCALVMQARKVFMSGLQLTTMSRSAATGL